MKIAFISLMGGMPWGGSEALWSKTALLSIKEGHKVFVSVYDWGIETSYTITELKKQDAQIHLRKKWSPTESILSKIKRRLSARFVRLSENWKTLADFKPDTVLISQGGNFDIPMHHKELYSILKNNGISYSFISHSHQQYSEIPEQSYYPFAKEVFRNAKQIFFVSQRQWKLTERMLCQKLGNASITWNPLNLSEKKYLNWPEGKIPQLAIVGALVSGKGHDTLFEILAMEKWLKRDWQLNIYGKGYGETYLHDLAVFYQIEGSIIFHGHVSSATDIWKKNHILLIPSSGEGLPISLVEAAICGRPAVVTDVGGNSEIVSEPETGFIAEAPSVQSFDKAMERAWENKDSWEEMGNNANVLAVKNIDLTPEKRIYDLLII